MPCRPVATYSGKTGSGKPGGGGGYATEADCLNACKEGACCEGTTCSVKPQCQCVCTTGSCCGPDTTVGSDGVMWPRCREETQAECAARGGMWRCNVLCPKPTDEKQSSVPQICTTLTGLNEPTFNGVGTTCEGNPCGCCCVDGTPTSITEQACSAAGGSWKTYPCDKTTPATVLLTLSLTGYNLPASGGVRQYDFSCIKSSYTLNRGKNWNGQLPGYSLATPEAAMGFMLSTSGSFASGYSNVSCGCNVPQLQSAFVVPRADAVYTYGGQQTLNCSPGSNNPYDFALWLWPNDSPEAIEIPGFCTGTFSISGTVYGVGNVQCGTFTLGNPLP